MPATLLALHGFTLNGAEMRAGLGPLAGALEARAELVCPDAPNVCSDGSVDRLYQRLGGTRRPPPHRCWWDASDDGRVYRGWEASRDALRPLLEPGPALLLGFSQGALLAAALAGLARRGDLPPVLGVVAIAGGLPRSELLAPLFDTPLAVPSLHIIGERDPIRAGAVALADRFDPALRRVVEWPGSHAIPTHGPAAEAIVDFVLTAFAPTS